VLKMVPFQAAAGADAAHSSSEEEVVTLVREAGLDPTLGFRVAIDDLAGC
jgi:hypothetical protein